MGVGIFTGDGGRVEDWWDEKRDAKDMGAFKPIGAGKVAEEQETRKIANTKIKKKVLFPIYSQATRHSCN